MTWKVQETSIIDHGDRAKRKPNMDQLTPKAQRASTTTEHAGAGSYIHPDK
jgi:hypothetical protein